MERLLILDNYDSFTFNLLHLVEKVSDIQVDVFRNDQITLSDVNDYDKIILSPGPGLPKDAGIMPELLRTYHSRKSILGVCLGMQAIAEFYGATLTNLDLVCHGLATPVITENDAIFHGCPKEFLVGRYHSWAVSINDLPKELQVICRDKNNTIMTIKHCKNALYGIQFHPESILSEYGELILKNWINQ